MLPVRYKLASENPLAGGRKLNLMDVVTFQKLLTTTGQSALAAAAELGPTVAKYPAMVDRLRKHFADDLVRAALDTVLLREKGAKKFSRGSEMYFTRETLEMATSESVARYRASRFAEFHSVADLCSGIGGDAIGLTLAGRSVTAVEREALLLRMAEANLAVHGVSAQFIEGDVRTLPLTDVDAAFADPGRRRGEKRVLSVENYDPPLGELVGRFPLGFPMGVKLAPGAPREDLARYDAVPEFIALDGELKECCLWFGPLRPNRVTATVLPGPHQLQGDRNDLIPFGSMGHVIYDPNPAVSRSGLLAALAHTLNAHQFDPGVAFLTSNQLTTTPFATAYSVQEAFPFKPKLVGAWLREHGVGRITAVKRGTDVDTDALVKSWKLKGDEHRVAIITRNWVIVATRFDGA